MLFFKNGFKTCSKYQRFCLTSQYVDAKIELAKYHLRMKNKDFNI